MVEKVRRPHFTCCESGLTLTELLVVMAIAFTVTMVSGISIFNNARELSIQQEGSAIEGFLVKARDRALLRGQCTTVTQEPQRLIIASYKEPKGDCVPPFTDRDGPELVLNLEKGGDLSPFSTGNPLIFNPSGGTETPDQAIATIEYSRAQDSMTFQILPAIGQVNVE